MHFFCLTSLIVLKKLDLPQQLVHWFSHIFHQVVTHRLFDSFTTIVFLPLLLHVVCYVRIVIIIQNSFDVVLVQNTWKLRTVNCNWMQFLWTGKYSDLKLNYFCPFQGLSHIRPQAGIGEEAIMGIPEPCSLKEPQQNSGSHCLHTGGEVRGGGKTGSPRHLSQICDSIGLHVSSPLMITHCFSEVNGVLMLYKKSFINQAYLVKMAGYCLCSSPFCMVMAMAVS